MCERHLTQCLTHRKFIRNGSYCGALNVIVKVKFLSRVRLLATPWTVACIRIHHPWDSPSKSPGVCCHFLLWGILPSQGSNPGLLHCRQTLYRLSRGWIITTCDSGVYFQVLFILIFPSWIQHIKERPGKWFLFVCLFRLVKNEVLLSESLLFSHLLVGANRMPGSIAALSPRGQRKVRGRERSEEGSCYHCYRL